MGRRLGALSCCRDGSEDGGVLYVANEGAVFAEENFRAITELALSSKAAGEGIGNKGLGFRSVLQLTDWPEIDSQALDDAPLHRRSGRRRASAAVGGDGRGSPGLRAGTATGP
ncbi:sacsin N-terminal ATP-binding-like domain-containing protein [Streptomyces collinus]|uniref:sacsin N-terminal ATP-binding-like domain-containing protein n=1 Tax=Streptomyces collinus TaxID=42684 RepID=UPI003F53FCE7